MNLKCEFNEIMRKSSIDYICSINQQPIEVGDILIINGTHLEGKSHKDVKEVRIWKCDMTRVPQGLMKIFPNINALCIWHSNLKNIKKEDLAEYILLKRISFSFNQIEFLPGDLFNGFENLEDVAFYSNNLQIIEPTILDGLNNLTYVDFSDNPNYETHYPSIDPEYADIKTVKDELNNVFRKITQLYKALIRAEFETELEIFSDIKNILKEDSHKDFKILIGDHQFPVHKLILASRSPTLADILKNNPEVENLSLQDIPVETFELILKYMYSAELPKLNEYDQFSLFAAAGRLKIEKLKIFVATHIQINEENALDILKLSSKYEHNELKQKSFDIIKKKYPKLEFKDEWIEDPEVVRMIIELFEEKEEAIRKLEEDFEKRRISMKIL